MKMRLSEEEAIGRCKKTLRKIRQAMVRQRSINMDVQTGISELEELIDVIEDYRRSWMKAEREKHDAMRVLDHAREHKEAEETTNQPVSNNKRCATSPADILAVKKIRDKTPEQSSQQHERQEIGISKVRQSTKRRRKKKEKPEKRPEAVLVRPSSGHTYAEVLKDLRAKVKPAEADVAVRSISKTKSGSILLVMAKGGRKEKFCEAIKDSLKEAAIVEDLKPKTTLEIQDLDALSSVEEIKQRIEEVTGVTTAEIRVHLTRPNWRDQRRAFVSLPMGGANKILETERILIGITNCRVRYREEVIRCFRCFASGHMQWKCKGPDRRELCIRCGESGYKMSDCSKRPKCCICTNEGRSLVDHLPGSRSCGAVDRQL